MLNFFQLGFFYLYIPEDKKEYIPVVLEFLIVLLVCILVFRWLKRKSNKEAAKAREIEARVMQMKKEQTEKQPN